MASANYVIKQGQVESIDDNMDGGRIKVRLSEDQKMVSSELPYAFPLLPKAFQSVPKVGECVFVICSDIHNGRSQRYYIGPVISQMQNIDNDQYNYGAGSANSLLQGAIVGPMKPISKWSITDGAFPDKTDVALIGRRGNDVILKDNEIDLRCGIRQDAYADEDLDLRGNVRFNSEDPTYIQMMHKPTLRGAGGPGVVNVVSNKINLISHNGEHEAYLTNPSSKSIKGGSDPLIKESDMVTLMASLHAVPFGDILAKILEKMCDAILNHIHKISPLPVAASNDSDPTIRSINECKQLIAEMNSKNIKIN